MLVEILYNTDRERITFGIEQSSLAHPTQLMLLGNMHGMKISWLKHGWTCFVHMGSVTATLSQLHSSYVRKHRALNPHLIWISMGCRGLPDRGWSLLSDFCFLDCNHRERGDGHLACTGSQPCLLSATQGTDACNNWYPLAKLGAIKCIPEVYEIW